MSAEKLKKLIKVCNELNYNFNMQYFDGEFNIYVSDNNVLIENAVATIGGYDSLDDALTQILKMI